MDQSYQTHIFLLFAFLFGQNLKIYSLIGLFCAFGIPYHGYHKKINYNLQVIILNEL